jgi:hypothetical protein
MEPTAPNSANTDYEGLELVVEEKISIRIVAQGAL